MVKMKIFYEINKSIFTFTVFYCIMCMQLPHTLFHSLLLGRIALAQCGAFLCKFINKRFFIKGQQK